MVGWKDHLKRAVELVGSQAKLAAEMTRCGDKEYSQSRISWLITTAERIPAEDALAVHLATDGEVPANKLRPDVWPTSRHVPVAAAHRVRMPAS